MRSIIAVAVVVLVDIATARAAVDFGREVQPVIESACLSCHTADSPEGGLILESREAAMAGGDTGPAIVPGKPDESPFYTLTVLPEDHEKVMPPDGWALDAVQTARIRKWIKQGAKWPADAKLEVKPRIDFVADVQPILETHCVTCHSPENLEGDLDLTTAAAARTTGLSPPVIRAFDPDESTLYTTTRLEKEDPLLMPPADQGGPLDAEAIETLRLWISQGAIWPDDVKLKARAKEFESDTWPDDMELVRKIRALIIEKSQVAGEASMEDYSSFIPQTGAPYHMVAIRGGEFVMGSPESEPGHDSTEGPQRRVQISPFWLGKYEVTWDEYEPYMMTHFERFKNGVRKDYDPEVHTIVDAVTGPTRPYVEMSFGMGQEGYPAISMTHHAANKYCQWLSAQTGHFYRLPTEAEWEYACRAGSTTAYSFGDDPAELDEYAWYRANSEEKYQQVGTKKPNAWGLFDMHGNVMEWTADQFIPDYFERLAGGAKDPYVRPTTRYPRSARGGGWDSEAEQLRSASRLGSDPSWQQQDPQLPKSIWYLTDAQWLGFRICRPLEVPSAEEMYFHWFSAAGK